MNLIYRKGMEALPEAVLMNALTANDQKVYTVDVDLLICGVRFAKNGEEVVDLDAATCLEILCFVRDERAKIIHKAGQKSMQDWRNSGLRKFEDFFLPGDVVAEDVVEYFIEVCPPHINRSTLVQGGEPFACEKDVDGKMHSTYTTFAFANGCWWYAGTCFSGETKHVGSGTPYLEQRIAELEKE